MWSLREGDINQKEFINKARNTFGYKGIEGTYYYNSIPPRSERVLYESPKVNKVYEASRANLISETSWKNLTKKQKDSLTFGKSTYQDYIDLFNRQMERAFKEKTE